MFDNIYVLQYTCKKNTAQRMRLAIIKYACLLFRYRFSALCDSRVSIITYFIQVKNDLYFYSVRFMRAHNR